MLCANNMSLLSVCPLNRLPHSTRASVESIILPALDILWMDFNIRCVKIATSDKISNNCYVASTFVATINYLYFI